MRLPSPLVDEEDAFVAALDAGDMDPIIEAIEAAMAERRPRLASRLVHLLDDQEPTLEIDPSSPVARARRAASLLLVVTPDSAPEQDPHWREFEEAFAEFRRRRMRRMKYRYRRWRRDSDWRR
jgi:hypothetical protein